MPISASASTASGLSFDGWDPAEAAGARFPLSSVPMPAVRIGSDVTPARGVSDPARLLRRVEEPRLSCRPGQ